MTKVFIIIGVIFLLLALILYLIFGYNIEKFTTNPLLNLSQSEMQILRDIQRTEGYRLSLQQIYDREEAIKQQASTQAPTQAPTQTPTGYNKSDFWAVISTYEPWGIYYAGNFADNKLNDISNTTHYNREAIVTGNVINKNESGNGALGTIKSISGTTATTIEWPFNSISDKFTICSITRYTGNNNKRILTARDAKSSNDWIHGHKDGKRGVVYYNEFKTNSSPELNLNGNITDWVVTCAKNDNNIPNNVYVNGVPSGIKPGGQGNLKLAINKIDDITIINEQSDFALSYIIIWNRNLTDIAINIISKALMNYLDTGEELIFNTNNLSTDDKVKVTQSSQKLITAEIMEMQAANEKLLLKTTSEATADTVPSTTQETDASLYESEKLKLYNRLASIEKAISDKAIGTPSASVIDLNRTPDNTCISFPTMPKPIEASFTDTFDYKTLVNPIINDSKESTYIWCNKCDANKSDDCENYNICYNFYNEHKSNYTEDYFNKSKEIEFNSDYDIYNACSTIFKDSFPKAK